MINEINTALADITARSIYAMTPYGFAYPSKGGDGGDDCLWLGILSSVGFPDAFDLLMQCQAAPSERDAGMFYRNPVRRFNQQSGFSRDMAMGVMLGFACDHIGSSVKEPHATRWINYIDKSRPCSVKKPKWAGGGCLIRSPIYRYAPDDRSDIPPAGWALMGRVWDANGWKKNGEMRNADGMDGDWSIQEARVCSEGYQLHLHALEGYLKRIIKQSRAYAQEMADICHSRKPENLFYKILAQDAVLDEDIVRFMDICSKWTEPKPTWIWEQSRISECIENGDACGWDLVFMGRLILKYRGEL